NEMNDDLKDILKSHLDKQLKLLVYNSKHQNVRCVEIVPSNNWNGQGLLGVSIRFASFESANENVWHILDVAPNSPASVAGLQSYSDYIIGADSFLQDTDDIFNLIQTYESKPLKLFVYNSETDCCREHWGGSGLLGCDIGYGYLHRIPKPKSNQYPLTDQNKQPVISSQQPSISKPPAANIITSAINSAQSDVANQSYPVSTPYMAPHALSLPSTLHSSNSSTISVLPSTTTNVTISQAPIVANLPPSIGPSHSTVSVSKTYSTSNETSVIDPRPSLRPASDFQQSNTTYFTPSTLYSNHLVGQPSWTTGPTSSVSNMTSNSSFPTINNPVNTYDDAYLAQTLASSLNLDRTSEVSQNQPPRTGPTGDSFSYNLTSAPRPSMPFNESIKPQFRPPPVSGISSAPQSTSNLPSIGHQINFSNRFGSVIPPMENIQIFNPTALQSNTVSSINAASTDFVPKSVPITPVTSST
ncbi:Golgi reassembly-stacking protein 1, partial [Sarcoptes scabiei]